MFEALHLRVTKLVRVRIGSLMGEGIASGDWRRLEPGEVEALKTNPKPQKQPADVEKAKRHRGSEHKSARRPARKAAKNAAKKTARRPAKLATI